MQQFPYRPQLSVCTEEHNRLRPSVSASSQPQNLKLYSRYSQRGHEIFAPPHTLCYYNAVHPNHGKTSVQLLEVINQCALLNSFSRRMYLLHEVTVKVNGTIQHKEIEFGRKRTWQESLFLVFFIHEF